MSQDDLDEAASSWGHDMRERFGQLREVAHTQRGQARWEALVRQLEGWPEQPLRELVLPYLLDLLREDSTPRPAPQAWLHVDEYSVWTHPAWPLVSALDLSLRRLGPEGVRALLRAQLTRDLSALMLGYNALRDEGAAALASSPLLRQLTTLHLWSNDIGPEGARWPARHLWARSKTWALAATRSWMRALRRWLTAPCSGS